MAQLILWNSYDFTKHSLVRPLGPHQLASWLTSQGYTVKVIDFCSLMNPMELASVTAKYIGPETIAIGVSNTFWDEQHVGVREPEWVYKARTLLEPRYPKVDWILGGSRNSYLVLDLALPWTKFTGYSEDSLLAYLDRKSSKVRLPNQFDIQLNCGHYLDDLNITASEVLPIELSRGCQFKCRFCRFAELGKKKNTYIRRYDLIEQELLSNYERFGVTRYMVMDDTANESIEKLEALADIAQRLPFKLEWVGYVRLDLIGNRPDTAELLVESGLRACYFGIESFHPKASMIVGKGWNGKHGKEFLLKLKDQWGDRVVFEVGLIAGLRGETAEDLDATQQWCIDNEIYSWRWTPLSISRQPEQLWKSEFDIEYAKYGYSFPDGENYAWVSEDWTYRDAIKKAEQLNNDLKDRVLLNPWHAAQVASLGYEFDDLFKINASKLDYHELFARTKTRLKEYINYQKLQQQS